MARHFNPAITADAQRYFSFRTGDALSDDVIPNIQPVVNLIRSPNIVRINAALNAASATVFTTPTDRDFFLVNVGLTLIKDVTSTSTFSRVSIVLAGVRVAILQVDTLSVTAQTAQLAFNLSYPIKIDPGTTILVENGTAVANIDAACTIVGYTTDTPTNIIQ